MDACGCAPPPGDGHNAALGFASIFDGRRADADLRRYRSRGPDRSTRMLLELLAPFRAPGGTLLDIGGGIGAIDQAFLAAGAARAVLVDGSAPYQARAREVAERAGTVERMQFMEGDFVRRAPELEAADVVTLDRVVCCYRDADALIGLSSARARRAYGLVLPRDRWFLPPAMAIFNVLSRLRRRAYRAYAHPNRRIDALVAESGLRPAAEARTLYWRVVVYERTGAGGRPTEPLPAG